jgi:hypothetical protein
MNREQQGAPDAKLQNFGFGGRQRELAMADQEGGMSRPYGLADIESGKMRFDCSKIAANWK